MRIAIYHNVPTGGAKRAIFEIARELKRRGHYLEEFAPNSASLDFLPLTSVVDKSHYYPFKPVSLLQQRIPMITPYIHLAQGISTLIRLNHLERYIASDIDARGFDLVFAHDCMIGRAPGVLRYLNTPSVFYCHHGMVSRVKLNMGDQSGSLALKRWYYAPPRIIFRSIMRSREKLTLHSASIVLTNSLFSRRFILDHYGVSAVLVYLGVNPKVFRPLSLQSEDYAICVGRLSYQKGQRFLVEAFSTIPEKARPKLLFVADMVDDQEARSLCQMAWECGVEIKVDTIRDDEELVRAYNRAVLSVYAPYLEPFGLVVLEAMACGVPVVAVKEGGIREIIRDGETGILAQRDPGEFGQWVVKMLSDEAKRRQLALQSVHEARTRWTWERTCDDLERVFHKVLGK